MSRRYAKDTSVPISRSRAHIETLLRDWGCKRIAWEDDFENRRPDRCRGGVTTDQRTDRRAGRQRVAATGEERNR